MTEIKRGWIRIQGCLVACKDIKAIGEIIESSVGIREGNCGFVVYLHAENPKNLYYFVDGDGVRGEEIRARLANELWGNELRLVEG